MEKIIAFIKEHPLKFVAFLLIVLLLVFTYGCEPKVTSVVDPPRQVNKFELEAEVNLVITQFENKFESIAKQEEFKRAVFAAALEMFQTGTVNPVGVAVTLGGILGFGALGDDVRLRRRIKRNGSTSPTV